MSAMTIDPAATPPPTQGARSTGRRTLVRPDRRPTRGRGPHARPARAVPAPSIHFVPPARVHSCTPATAALVAVRPAGWQLTDRGIAVILVGALMIMVAAITVIGLTAVRVTGDSYQGYGQSQLAQR